MGFRPIKRVGLRVFCPYLPLCFASLSSFLSYTNIVSHCLYYHKIQIPNESALEKLTTAERKKGFGGSIAFNFTQMKPKAIISAYLTSIPIPSA